MRVYYIASICSNLACPTLLLFTKIASPTFPTPYKSKSRELGNVPLICVVMSQSKWLLTKQKEKKNLQNTILNLRFFLKKIRLQKC